MMISVIIPCYNSEQFITRALISVLNQTYTEYEVIVVDNNSTDNTYDILKAYKEKFPHQIRILKESKKGAPAARNKGLAAATGDWVQFLDSDDELLPGKFQSQIEIAQSSKADIIVGECYLYTTVKNETVVKTRGVETGDIWEALLTSKLGITSSNLWRREALVAVRGWNETKTSSQEYDLVFRMIKENNTVDFCLIPQTIVHVREDSIHKSADENRLVEILDNNVSLRLRIKEYLRLKGLLTKRLAYTADTYIYTYLVNTTGLHYMSLETGIVPKYVRRTLHGNDLHLPLNFILRFHFDRIKNKIKRKVLFQQPILQTVS